MSAQTSSRIDGQTVAADYAEAYARNGWYVLPVHPGAKRPQTRHGHKDATRDLGKIRAWWKRTPHANVGVAVEPSGLIVVDIDPRNSGTLDALPTLPPTLTAHTGGGGLHLFFRRPTPCPRLPGKLAPGIDLKSDGYVLVAPSRTADAYTFDGFDPLRGLPPDLPAYPLAILHGAAAPVASKPAANAASAPKKPAHRLAATIPQGERNGTLLSLAGGLVRRGFIGDALNQRLQKVNAERCKPPLGPDEIDSLCAAATAYGSSGFVMLPHALLDAPGWRALSPAAQVIALVAIRRAVNDAPFALVHSDFATLPGFANSSIFSRHRAELLHAEFLHVDSPARCTQSGKKPALYTIDTRALQGSLRAESGRSETSRDAIRYGRKVAVALRAESGRVLKSTNSSCCALDVWAPAAPESTPGIDTESLARLYIMADYRPIHIPNPGDYYAPPQTRADRGAQS